MQKKTVVLLTCLFAGVAANAQTTDKEKITGLTGGSVVQSSDTTIMDEDAPSSFGMAGLGISNGLFSVHNRQLNARQSSTSTIIFDPSVGYFHKSGFSLSAGVSLLQQAKKGFGINQFVITPAFELPDNDNWGFGIAYSRYIAKNKYSAYAPPLQNDIYTYVSYQKPWLEPGIAIGYASGQYTEVVKGKNGSSPLIDTGVYKTHSFSIAASVSHHFEWEGLMSEEDEMSFTSSLMLNFSSDSTQTISHSLSPLLAASLKKLRHFSKLQGANHFQAESIGLNLAATYTIGNFSVVPELYLDYYLPATTDNRFSQVFGLSVNYYF